MYAKKIQVAYSNNQKRDIHNGCMYTENIGNMQRMNEHDRKLIEWAEKQCFEDLDESMAETEEGKRKLHIIIMKKYHADEYSCGIL